MAQRAEPPDSLDDFPTPPWATRALLEFIGQDFELKKQVAWEPAANRGFMLRTLAEVFGTAYGSDIADYGDGHPIHDFLSDQYLPNAPEPDWIISNPPFRTAAKFAEIAIGLAPNSALFCRLQWLEGAKRYRQLWEFMPPSYVLVFADRVPLVRGRYDPQVSSATAYAWFIWNIEHAYSNPILHWIPPGTRRRLENKETDA